MAGWKKMGENTHNVSEHSLKLMNTLKFQYQENASEWAGETNGKILNSRIHVLLFENMGPKLKLFTT